MIRFVVGVGILGFLASLGQAQWTPTKIGFWGPFNYVSIKGATSAGFGGYGAPDYANDFHALYWKTGDQAFTDLNPAGFYNSYIMRCVGDYQYGYGMTMDGDFHALRWQGTAESAVDLHPGGIWTNSQIMGASSEDMVGICRTGFSDPGHAALWSGSTSNFVDLTPTGADGATPYACSPNNQVGIVSNSSKNHAALWHGTADGMVDLNPAWSDQSYGLFASGETQGGISNQWFNGSYLSHATLWRGTAESAVDLTETGYISSNMSDMNSQYQVGSETKFISPYMYSHAVVWQGTAESAFDLQPSLSSITSEVQGSGALAITEEGDIIGAVGSATDGNFLVKWTHVVPEPGTFLALGTGLAVLARRRRRS